MEIKNVEKSKSHKMLNSFNITPTKQKNEQDENIPLQLKSGNLSHLIEFNFDEKLKKFFDKEKFSIGNQFDQKGSEKFLAEKDECLKFMDLDYTILEKKKLKKNKKKRENKSHTKIKDLIHNVKYIPQIEINYENVESFFSTESFKQIFK